MAPEVLLSAASMSQLTLQFNKMDVARMENQIAGAD
jgi:hypothetical protein